MLMALLRVALIVWGLKQKPKRKPPCPRCAP